MSGHKLSTVASIDDDVHRSPAAYARLAGLPAAKPPVQLTALVDPEHEQDAVIREHVVHDPIVADPEPMKRVVRSAN